MRKPAGCVEIFLQPGEYYWGDQHTRIRTILGSCVTLTAWHPQLLVGGMTHMIIPERSGHRHEAGSLNAKYADEALQLLMADMRQHCLDPRQFQLKLFGGGEMFARIKHAHDKTSAKSIGQKNIEVTKGLLDSMHLKLHATNVGGSGHRSVIFDVWSGYVWVKHVDLSQSAI